MTQAPTRVVVVEDSPTQRAFLRQSLEADGDIIVVGEAGTVATAVAAVAHGQPDLVTVDLDIPGGGHTLIERIMRSNPRPILVLSGQVGRRSPETTRALGAGAAAVMEKPLRWDEATQNELRRRVRGLRGMKRMAVTINPAAEGPAATPAQTASRMAARSAALSPPPAGANRPRRRGRTVVALAASTGGPGAVAAVLRGIVGIDVPVVLVQHIGAQSVPGLADWLTKTSGWNVSIATDGELLVPGHVLLGPYGQHLVVNEPNRVAVVDEPMTAHKPSADVLFTSLARSIGKSTVAAILTGMGNDGAAGLLAVRDAGGVTIAQDEATSAVFGMPKAAIELGAARHTVALDDIADHITRATRTVF